LSKKPPLQNQGFKWWEHVTIESEQAAKMAELTKGYPFAFQVLGYLTWNHEGDYEAVIDEYEQYLSEFVYDKIWSELSQKDRIVARGIEEVEKEESTKATTTEPRTYEHDSEVWRGRLNQLWFDLANAKK
jgi:Zn-dependent M32 family carboxypeptidase